MTFESLRHQISHFVHESREPVTSARLREICDMAADDKALANALYNMVKDGQLTKHDAPEGSGMGVRFAYGPGKVKLGAESGRGNDAGGGDRKPAASRQPSVVSAGKKQRRAKGKHRKHGSRGLRKVQRKTATSRLHGRILIKPETTFGTAPPDGFSAVLRATGLKTTKRGISVTFTPIRWALTSDGALVLLGEPQIEIPKGAVRPLVDFLRTLDKGQA